jgi:signal transduction histidine kinase
MVGLAAIVEEFRLNTVIDVELRTTGFDREPSPDATAHLLGIVNEALSNIARHSGASRAFVEVDVDEGSFHIAVADNGHGFDAASVGALGHQGLANMRSRAVEIGAMITFESGPGGTSVQVTLPPEPDPEQAGAVAHD